MSGFVRTDREVREIRERMRTNRYYDIERVSVTYRTDRSIIDRVLPPGLDPTDQPVVQADVMRVGHSNCVGGFDGGGLYVRASHDGRVGKYCLALPMSSDAAITWGRELFGEPKKRATVSFDRSGDHIQAAVSRYGDRIIDIEATMEESAAVDPEPRSVFHYKYLPDVTGGGFQFDPTLVEVTFESRVHRYETGTGTVSLATTTHDPLGEIAVRDVLEASYSQADITSRQENLTTVDPEAFLPYAYGMGSVDDWLALDDADAASTSEAPR